MKMKRMKEYFKVLVEQWAGKRRERYLAELYRRSCEELQVMEFDGELFLSYQNTPLVNVTSLKDDITKALGDSRSVWVRYHLRNISGHKQ